MARYVWTVDSLDADGYVAVFSEDAVIDSNGSISKGHEAIRNIVTGLIQRRDDNKAKGSPTANLYHVISNVRISFPKPGEALHQSVLADRTSRQVRHDGGGRDGPFRRPAYQAQWQVVDSVAKTDRLHRLIYWQPENDSLTMPQYKSLPSRTIRALALHPSIYKTPGPRLLSNRIGFGPFEQVVSHTSWSPALPTSVCCTINDSRRDVSRLSLRAAGKVHRPTAR